MTVEWEINNELDKVMPDRGVVGEIKYTAPYALYVEFDTAYAGSSIPFEPLHEWTLRNWSDISTGIKDMAEEQLRDDASNAEIKRQVTRIIIGAIKKNGIDGVHFGQRSIEHGKEKAEMVANVHKERENPYELMAENLVEIMFEHSQGIINEEAKDTEELKDSGEWDVRQVDDV